MTISRTSLKAVRTYILHEFIGKRHWGLAYHNWDHTLRVANAALEIALAEGVTDRESRVISVAALFHDIAYEGNGANHEKKSIEEARQVLPKMGVEPEDIEKVCKLIKATKMPQKAKTQHEKILCDADLAGLGMDAYWEYSELLKKEYEEKGVGTFSEIEWLKDQIKFMEDQTYFTKFAQNKYGAAVSVHLGALRRRLDRELAELED